MADTRITRRAFPLAAATIAAGCSRSTQTNSARSSPVFIGRAQSYSSELGGLIERGVRACGLSVSGQCVLLKPNLVEFDSATAINTNVAVIAAVREVLLK